MNILYQVVSLNKTEKEFNKKNYDILNKTNITQKEIDDVVKSINCVMDIESIQKDNMTREEFVLCLIQAAKRLRKLTYIYCIRYKGKIIYLGSTVDLKVREKAHNTDLPSKDYMLYQYLRFKNVDYVCLEVLEVGIMNEENKLKLEEQYIRNLHNEGFKLCNMIYPISENDIPDEFRMKDRGFWFKEFIETKCEFYI